jgi:hypothetical protein
MNKRKILADPAKIKALADKLSRCEQVTRHDSGKEPEAWTLAHSFADLEESFRKFLDEQLPTLAEGPLDSSSINELLLEIGEEFRHILYHIKDPKFFRYLLDESGEEPGTD